MNEAVVVVIVVVVVAAAVSWFVAVVLRVCVCC